MHITYYTEDPAHDYAKGLTAATNQEELCKHIALYDRVASDALEVASTLSGESFENFRDGLRKERRGKFAGEEWAKNFSAILMPAVMFEVSMVAEQFKAPWGCAYIRLRDVGRIIEKDGIASLPAGPGARI